jgi:hypothetical protein
MQKFGEVYIIEKIYIELTTYEVYVYDLDLTIHAICGCLMIWLIIIKRLLHI